MPLQGPLSLRIRIPPDVVSPPIHRGPSRDVPGAGGRCVEHDCHLKGWGSQRVLCPKVPIQATAVPRCQDRLILPSSNVLSRSRLARKRGLRRTGRKVLHTDGVPQRTSPSVGSHLLSVLRPRLAYAAISWSHHRGPSLSPPDPPLPAPKTKT